MIPTSPLYKTLNFQGKTIALESGLLAKQAQSSVIASIDQTTVLVAVSVGEPIERDFLPLQIFYEERFYASGKIKTSRFEKREGKPTDSAVLNARMIDRSLRSLIDPNLRNEIQIVVTVLSLDEVNMPDTIAVLASSVALKLAGVKQFTAPVATVRLGLQDVKKYTLPQLKQYIFESQSFTEIRNKLADIYQGVSSDFWRINAPAISEYLNQKNPEWLAKFNLLIQAEKLGLQKTDPDQGSSQYQKIINPSYQQIKNLDFNLLVSGSRQSISMLEADGDSIPEEEFNNCLEVAVGEIQKLIDFQEEFLQEAETKNLIREFVPTLATFSQEAMNILSSFESELTQALFEIEDDKLQKIAKVSNLKTQVSTCLEAVCTALTKDSLKDNKHLDFKALEKTITDQLESQQLRSIFQTFSQQINLQDLQLENLNQFLQNLKETLASIDIIWDKLAKKIVRKKYLEGNKRIDGRDFDQVRSIECQVGLLSRTHGSGVFQRGETQVLNVLTLGAKQDAQILDNMEDFEETSKRYIHHYNFPQFSVGSVGRYGAPGRREIGHGNLAEKALIPVLPSEEDFPYTIRTVSECLESNGSSSMASTCASTLSLLDGGVPIKKLVGGIAMGLILNSADESKTSQNHSKDLNPSTKTLEYKIMTDINGLEDAYGDMDFKITGTEEGITAIQLDNKAAGLKVEILKEAIKKAKKGRLEIIEIMKQCIAKPREQISKYAPVIKSLEIPLEKIGEVIGPSGKVIKEIILQTDTRIDINDQTGEVLVCAKTLKNVEQAVSTINNIVRVYQVGDKVLAKIFRIENYGAFAKINNSKAEGLIHISEISQDRVKDVNSYLEINQEVEATIIKLNQKGQISLSLKK